VAIALTGQRALPFWSGSERDAKFDACDLKGVLEEFFEQFGLRGMTFARQAESTALFLESAVILQGKNQVGEFGQLSPVLAKKYDLRDAVLLAELNLDLLLARRNPAKSFKPLPAFPAIRRDVAMMVPEATTHDAVLQVVKQTKAGEPGSRGIVRRVPRQERSRRPKEPGLRLHLPRRGQNVDRRRSQRRAYENRGSVQSAVAGNGAGVNQPFQLGDGRQA
jgi:hypothetical protein